MTPLFPLSTDDVDALAHLHALAYSDPWTPHAFADLLAQPSGFGIGSRAGDALLAFVLTQIAGDRADILQIATHPGHQRQGHARALLNALETALIARGVTRLTLDVAADNVSALAFYAASRFTRDGVRPRYYLSGRAAPVDAILMSKTL